MGRYLAVLAIGLVTGGLASCADQACPDGTVELPMTVAVAPADCPEGPHVVKGLVDGAAFACELTCVREGELAGIVPGPCTGGAVLEAPSAEEPAAILRLPGKPEVVEVALLPADGETPLRSRTLLGGPASGCVPDEFRYELHEPYCRDGLLVDLPADDPGEFVFEGTADGAPFRCAGEMRVVVGEQGDLLGGDCDVELVRLEVETLSPDGRSSWDHVKAFFPGQPAEVVWSFTAPPLEDGGAPRTSSGTLTPAYGFDESGCRKATAAVSPP